MNEQFKIYTGYFAKAKQYESKGLVAVSIARYPPKWFSAILSYQDLAPTSDMFKMTHEQYLRKFDQILKSRNPNKVIADLKKMSGGIPVVLCCFEKPEDFCHRQLVAKWLNERTDAQVEEYGYVKEAPKKSSEDLPKQTSLF